MAFTIFWCPCSLVAAAQSSPSCPRSEATAASLTRPVSTAACLLLNCPPSPESVGTSVPLVSSSRCKRRQCGRLETLPACCHHTDSPTGPEGARRSRAKVTAPRPAPGNPVKLEAPAEQGSHCERFLVTRQSWDRTWTSCGLD